MTSWSEMSKAEWEQACREALEQAKQPPSSPSSEEPQR